MSLRKGRKLGKDDHIITLVKPSQRPQWMDEATCRGLPETLEVREVRVRICQSR